MYLGCILAYLAVIFLIGIFFSRKAKGSESFVSAKGELSWYVNAGTLIATYVGSGAIMGGAALAFDSGYNAIWLFAGGWLAIIAHVFLHKRISRLSGSTVSELIGQRYGETARVLSSIIIILAETSVVGYNLRSTGMVLNVITGIDPSAAVIFAAVFIVLITIIAGLVSVAYTDYAQAVVIIIAFIAALPVLVSTGGGVERIVSSLPETYFEPLGSFGGVSYILKNMLPTFCIVFMSQGFWQRFAASRSEGELKKTVFVWLIGVVVISMLIITYATFSKAVAPDATSDTIVVYAAKNILPTVIGLFILAATASVLITTADSYLLAAASVFINDLYGKLFPGRGDRAKLAASRACVVVLGVAAYVLVTFFPSILSMVFFAYTMEGGLIAAMIGVMFWRRATPQGGVASIAAVLVVTILWEIFKPFGIATIFATLISGVSVLVVVSLLTPPPDKKYLARFCESDSARASR